MTILIAPEEVRGDVPGLLCRGMPIVFYGETDTPRDEPLRGVVVGIDPLDFAFVDYRPLDDGRTSKARTVAEVDSPELGMRRIVEVDWSSPAALDACIRWLAARGHRCGWMRPREMEGAIDDPMVSKIIIARSVLNVAAGRGPVNDLLFGWDDYGDRAIRYSRRSGRGVSRVVTEFPGTESLGWSVGGVRGSETGDAGKLAADHAALADGCALLVPGGVMLRGR